MSIFIDIFSNIFFISFILVILSALIVYLLVNNRYKLQFISLKNEYELRLENIQDKHKLELKHFENIQDRHKLEIKHFQEKLDILDSSKESLKIEFENLSNRLYEENLKKSNQNLSTVLTPIKEQLNIFKSRVDDIYVDESKQRSSLLNEIKNLKDLNNQISKDTINLTNALKGDNKIQGDWGETILSKLLEQSGLNEGVQYSKQLSYNIDNNKRSRPDVIIHLPQQKDIIVDSKVSLKSYIKYNEALNSVDKDIALKQLINSIKKHIKDLGSKEYQDIKELKSLDFVLLFIPIESAFMLAISKDDTLFKMAFDNNIMLVSSSTLLISLRIINNIWQYEYQNKNSKEIASKAASLYDKFASFIEDMEDIGKSIDKSQLIYENAFKKLSKGKGNLISKVQEFKSLGIKSKKSLVIES